MAADRFSRFRSLEKERRDPPAPAANPGGSSARFESLETAAPAAGPASTSVVAERFAAPPGAAPAAPIRTLEDAQRAAGAPSGLELAAVNEGDQPFVRCARCEIDNHALAERCSHCGESLNTPAQRAYNERLWAQRQAEREQQLRELEAFVQQKAAPPPPRPGIATGLTPEQQRAVAERMAREIAAQTRRRLDGDLFASSWSHGRPDPLATLLEHLPEGARQVLLAVFLGVPALLLLVPRTRPIATMLLFVVGFVWLRLWLRR